MKFTNFKQRNLSVRECIPIFIMLSRYAPILMINSQAHMSKFVLKVLDLLVKECKITMLIKVMDISWLMTYVKQLEEEKFKERSSRESKRD